MGKLGRWLQVGANIGILSGLVLVGIQLKQTNELQKIEHISRSYELDMAHVLSAAGEDPAAILAKAVFNPEQMTPRDRIAYSASLQYMRTLAHRSAWLEGEGLFDEDWRNVTLPRIAFMFGGNPVGRQIWEGLKAQYSEFPEWLIELDKRIEQMPEDLHYQTWNSIGQLNANSEPTVRTPTDKPSDR